MRYGKYNTTRGDTRGSWGIIKEGEHAHHLIPVGLVKNNKVVKDALEAGYDINAKGMELV